MSEGWGLMQVLIMCGLPGSGKSTLARRFAKELDAVICSADDYYQLDGVYRFDPTRLPEAHDWCQQKARELLAQGRPVVIDNTNLKREHRAAYVAMAQEYGAAWQVVPPVTPWRWNPLVCHTRCRHGVPLAEIERMLADFERDATAVG